MEVNTGWPCVGHFTAALLKNVLTHVFFQRQFAEMFVDVDGIDFDALVGHVRGIEANCFEQALHYRM